MFKKLEREITIYNAIILVLFLIMFCIVMYIFIDGGLDQATKRSIDGRMRALEKMDDKRLEDMKNIYNYRIKNSKFEEFDEDRRHIFDFKLRTDVIIYDENKEVIYFSNMFLSENIDGFAKLLDRDDKKAFKANVGGRTYKILSRNFTDEKGYYVQAVYDYEPTKMFLITFLVLIICIGSVGIVILLLISKQFAKKAIIPIKMSWEKQKNFVADASHELRTPLSIIQINLEAAMTDDNQTIADNKAWLMNIKEEAGMMTKLVNDLLLLANIDSNHITIGQIEIDISAILHNTIDKLEDIASRRNITIYRDIVDGLSIEADRDKINQLIVILIDNAIKYNRDNGQIFIKLDEGEDIINLEVKDTGIGISRENLGKIFDRFFMEDKARSKEEGSSGLGLSIAKWIVKMHKGDISVVSNKNEGTTFTVKLKKTHN